MLPKPNSNLIIKLEIAHNNNFNNLFLVEEKKEANRFFYIDGAENSAFLFNMTLSKRLEQYKCKNFW